MLGVPGETQSSLDKKVKFIINLCDHENKIPLLGFLTPHPGTYIAKNIEKLSLVIIDNNFSNYTHLQPVCVPKTLGANAKKILIDAFNYISVNTNSEKYNPIID
jgi:radical SAM superfamily enzyme YgiQ (UPF0313 family)